MNISFTIDYSQIMLGLKLLLPIIVGWIIGRERKKNDKSGGSRTMALVCLTGSLLAILSLSAPVDSVGFFRLMSAGVQGISFLGMGLIIQHKGHIEGLTTAATTFILVPVGYLFGLGYLILGLTFSFLIFLILESKYILQNRRRK